MAHSLDRQKTKKLDPEDTGLLSSAIMGEEKKKKNLCLVSIKSLDVLLKLM